MMAERIDLGELLKEREMGVQSYKWRNSLKF